MTLFKHSLTAAADRLGLALIPKWRLDRLPFTEHLSKLLRQYEIDLVIDVGANVGQYRDFLRNEVGYEGWIASFEPDPDTWQILEERARNDPRWRAYHTALGAQAGTATLNVTGHSTLNSLLKPDFDSTDFAALKREVVREVTVPVSTLDHDLPQLLDEFKAKNAYLKLDTQGIDLEVMRNTASRTLLRCSSRARSCPCTRECHLIRICSSTSCRRDFRFPTCSPSATTPHSACSSSTA